MVWGSKLIESHTYNRALLSKQFNFKCVFCATTNSEALIQMSVETLLAFHVNFLFSSAFFCFFFSFHHFVFTRTHPWCMMKTWIFFWKYSEIQLSWVFFSCVIRDAGNQKYMQISFHLKFHRGVMNWKIREYRISWVHTNKKRVFCFRWKT